VISRLGRVEAFIRLIAVIFLRLFGAPATIHDFFVGEQRRHLVDLGLGEFIIAILSADNRAGDAN
jgi:hypothetical protein